MTHEQITLNHINQFGSITSLMAFRKYGITRLAVAISRLRRRGHSIKTTLETGKNRDGRVVTYARYEMS